MKEFLAELQTLLEKYNAVIFYDEQGKLSFELTNNTIKSNEICHMYKHVIDSNDLNLHENYESTTKSI